MALIFQDAPQAWDLLDKLVRAGCCSSNDEMGDSWCHFCNGNEQHWPEPRTARGRRRHVPPPAHRDECPWVEAANLLGLEIEPGGWSVKEQSTNENG